VGETGNDASLLTRNRVKRGSWLEWDGDGYLYAHTARYHDFIRYPVNDSMMGYWEATPGGGTGGGMPYIGWNGRRKKSKDGGSAAYYDNALYALKGGNTQQFWKYDIPETTWAELETMPKYGSTGRKKRVKHGADIESYGAGFFFSLKGNKTVEWWRYGLPDSAFGSRPSRSGIAGVAKTRLYGMTMAPNPLAGGFATVRFSLPKAGPATLSVFDIAGRSVLKRTMLTSRTGAVSLDLRELSSGVYLVRFDAEGHTESQKLVVEN
jgi:hypothetical protein